MKAVAAIFAHPDDEVLGCGASLHRFASEGCSLHILILATGLSSRGFATKDKIKKLRSQARAASKVLKAKSIEFCDFPDNEMDSVSLLSVVKKVEGFIKNVDPDVIFTHHSGDINIDHDITQRAVLIGARMLPGTKPIELLACEVLSSTEFGPANKGLKAHCYVRLSESDVLAAVRALKCYDEEIREWPHPRSHVALTHQLRLRGAECGWGAAEVFEVLRVIK